MIVPKKKEKKKELKKSEVVSEIKNEKIKEERKEKEKQTILLFCHLQVFIFKIVYFNLSLFSP